MPDVHYAARPATLMFFAVRHTLMPAPPFSFVDYAADARAFDFFFFASLLPICHTARLRH